VAVPPEAQAATTIPVANKSDLDLTGDSVERCEKSADLAAIYPFTAMTSISTRAARGNPADCPPRAITCDAGNPGRDGTFGQEDVVHPVDVLEGHRYTDALLELVVEERAPR